MNYKLFLLKFAIIIYRTLFLPIKVYFLRRKRIIRVAFIVSDWGKWKCDSLYWRMQEHERFEAILLVVPYLKYNNDHMPSLIKRLRDNHYNVLGIQKGMSIWKIVKPDLLFYQEPYNGVINPEHSYKYNLNSLFCYVNYAFHTIDSDWSMNQPLQNFAWQIYFENKTTIKSCSHLMFNKGKNCLITGLPITDQFLKPLRHASPWKGAKGAKKIIWAPHYTIQKGWALTYSTFLEYCDYMLDLASRHRNEIQVAFKPHPILLSKLYELWGKEKTDLYYSAWADGENTQLVLGEYVSLFMNSDAMIHDCSSFTIGYHYTKNPVLYLIKNEHHADELNEFGRMAFNLHYKGRCKEDIEAFIINVIEGNDEMKEAREKFYNDYLLPPDGKSASENIIKAILGK